MRIWKPKEIIDAFRLAEAAYVPVGWAHVKKDDGLLVVERCKADDMLRFGQLVQPGGRYEPARDKHLINTSWREANEESSVITVPGDTGKFTGFHENTIFKQREKVIAAVEGASGTFWIHYTDSGKNYVGKMFDLIPLSEPREPAERQSRNPRYLPIEQALSGSCDFTPANEILLEIVGKDYGKNVVINGDILLESCDLRNYLRTTMPFG